MEVVVTTGPVRHVKLQLNCHHQQTNIQLFTGWIPFLSPNQRCQRMEGKGLNMLVTGNYKYLKTKQMGI